RPGTVLKERSRFDPAFTVDVGAKGNSTGTAFSIRDEGVWFTARHVVDGCDRIGLQTGHRKAAKVQRVQSHPRADIAVLWTRGGRPAISIAENKLRVNQPAYHVGYPEGKPGQVESNLIGRRNMRTVGRYSQIEPVVAWVERQRHPRTQSLGGLSGGPALNEAGEIIGVTVAASKRRGRVFTTAPVTMDDMLAMANVRPEGKPSGGVTRQGPGDLGYMNYGEKLRDKLVVAKVLCLVDGPSRGRRATRGF
ncbi:MAG: serine protease, partial [Pseudomonadota bacterium]|nr:serine protease [Pseudomonadota bacterium]